MSGVSTVLGERLARCLPGATFELETLVRLVGIEETTEVSTAAVTCEGRARLLLNPGFVADYCARDEHLFLLVMHELWHVLLGHTTLYPGTGRAHNIAFDAIINAGLSRQHPQREYRGFFERLNPADSFPGVLLRPPIGWPHAPVYADVPGPPGTAELLERLYPPPGERLLEPTYDELLALLRAHAAARAAGRKGGVLSGGVAGDSGTASRPGDSGPPDDDVEPVLLGDHDRDTAGRGDPLLDGVLDRITPSWPRPPGSPLPLPGRGPGADQTLAAWIRTQPNAVAARRAFAAVVRRVLTPDPGGAHRRQRVLEPMLAGPGPLPNPADRLLPARRALQAPTVLAAQPLLAPARVPDRPARALVYLDVSGSMADVLPYLVDLLHTPARQRYVVVQQFSTVVAPLGLEDLARGHLTTTYGTDINCVLHDLLTHPHRRVLLITDGYVGTPAADLVTRLRERGVEVHALIPAGGDRRDLAPIAEITDLPALA